MQILHVVGARPNFMKAAPVYGALKNYSSVQQSILHTGQHYDFNMSDVFFQQLDIPAPDINLQVGSGSHGKQTAEIMSRFEEVVTDRVADKDRNFDMVLVYGDVNSTIAAALVCSKLGIQVAHVEAGLRSFDRTMPEEINRLLTDQLADLLFTPSEDGDRNLAREGIPAKKIHLVGNVMIDTLVRMLPNAVQYLPPETPNRFALVTLHRPSNVDDLPWLQKLLTTLVELSSGMTILFPVHPRTRTKLADIGFHPGEGLRLMEPLPYMSFLALQQRATMVITDSGGIQEETTFLGTPCLTVRENTERPVTVDVGTNILVGRNLDLLRTEAHNILSGKKKKGAVPPLWDGQASDRIAAIIAR
jgi:UDP-N-acetylglucosamine 2-epimerase (non-hydrolysing)